MKEVTLPSGNVLVIGVIPFEAANNLKKEFIRQLGSITASTDIMAFAKESMCGLFGSDEVEKLLWECMKRCQYGPHALKIDKSTFESVEARTDFSDVQYEVAMEALKPFWKGLFAVLKRSLQAVTENIPQ